MTQHPGFSVNAGFSKLNSPVIVCCAVTGRASSLGKENQTGIATGNTGESGVALGIETIAFLRPKVSTLLPVFKQRMGKVERESQCLALLSLLSLG